MAENLGENNANTMRWGRVRRSELRKRLENCACERNWSICRAKPKENVLENLVEFESNPAREVERKCKQRIGSEWTPLPQSKTGLWVLLKKLLS